MTACIRQSSLTLLLLISLGTNGALAVFRFFALDHNGATIDVKGRSGTMELLKTLLTSCRSSALRP